MDKKSPGRPRLYSSSTDKVDAFRKRQESAGYVRKEILVTKENWARIGALATLHKVGVIDAAAGLLEQGLEDFEATHVEKNSSLEGLLVPRHPLIAGATSAISAPRAFAAVASASSAPLTGPTSQIEQTSDINPITRFFAKRKEQNDA